MTLTIAPTAPPGPGADEVVTRLEQIASLYAELSELPVFALTDARLDARMAAAVRARAAADEMVARIVGEADASGAAMRAGASSTRAWLIAQHGMSPRDAVRAVAHGTALTPLTEATRLAWARGEIDGDRAEAVATAVGGLPDTADPARVEAVQAGLLAKARTLTVKELRLACSRAVEPAGPAEADRARGERLAEQERDAYRRATFRGRKGLDGVATFSGTMPKLCLDMLMANLDAIASPRRDHLRDQRPADAEEDPIPYPNRLGMALCDVVERIGETGLPADGVNATLVVTVDERSLRDRVGTATLSSGDDASAGGLRRIACGAGVLPMVLGGGSALLDLGRERRLFDKSQRIALAVRDGGCVFAGCERPPGWTQAHHMRPWAEGGRTDLSNAALLLCGFHHRLIHSGDGWEIQMASDGIPETVPPDRVDRRRRPIRHQRHQRHRRRDRERSRPGAG